MNRTPLVGGIELGGTKCVCLLGTGPNDIRSRVVIPTGIDPDATLRHVEHALRASMVVHGPITALGIASFGPLDLDKSSPNYGGITSTAKTGWKNTSLVGRLARAFDVPIGFDTDVNGAALAEGRWGAAQEVTDFAYITVGTGVGVGVVINGRPVHGFSHPEYGHIRIARLNGDAFQGSCVFHGDCVEGLASGTAIAARAGVSADQIPQGDAVWAFVAHALAQLLHTLVLSSAPRRILLGGGVTDARPDLLPTIRGLLIESLNGYLDLHRLVGAVENYIVPPGLGPLAGPLGALALAADAS